MTAATTRPTPPRLWSDLPIAEARLDLLRFDDYAAAIAGHLDSGDTPTPLAIAISGRWGTGKTSLARLIERRLTDPGQQSGGRPHVVCWFNAWMHEEAPNLGAAFAAEVARAADRRRSWLLRVLIPRPMAMLSGSELWRRRVKLALSSFSVAVVGLLITPLGGIIRDELGPDWSFLADLRDGLGPRLASLIVTAAAALACSRWIFGGIQSAARFIDEPRSESAKGSVDEVRRQLGTLIKQALWPGLRRRRTPGRRFVIFVDDLERCRPGRAVEVCEVANRLLAHPDVVTVLIADMSVLEAEAEMTRQRFLEKVVQVQFDVPVLPVADVQNLLVSDATDERTRPAPRRARRDWGRYVGLALGVFTAVATVAAVVGLPWLPIGVLLWLPAAGAAALVVRSAIAERRRVRRIAQLSRSVSVAGPSMDEHARVRDEATKFKLDPEIGERVIQTRLVDSPAWKRAEAAALRHSSDVPRAAKRIVNTLRLYLAVGWRRGLLDDDRTFTPELLGRWVALRLRWPAVARRIDTDRGRLSDLEGASGTTEDLTNMLKKLDLTCDRIDDLRALLIEQPRLSSAVNELTELRRARTRR